MICGLEDNESSVYFVGLKESLRMTLSLSINTPTRQICYAGEPFSVGDRHD